MLRIALLLSAFAAAPAISQTVATPQAEQIPVVIETNLGRIVIALDKTHAPVSTANFLHYVDTHRFDGESFYRAMHMPAPDGGPGGLIQGGVRSDARKLYPPVAHEPTSVTGLHN